MPFYDDYEADTSQRDAGYRQGGGGGGYRGKRGGGDRGDRGDRGPRRHQPPLHTEKIITDRKVFFLDLKENDRGRVIKITEDVRGRRDTIMIPMECLADFIESLRRIEEAAGGSGSYAQDRGDDDDADYEEPRD